MFLILNSSIKKTLARTSMTERFARVSSRAGKAALLAAVFAGAGLGAHQAHAADATANGTAEVITAIGIAKNADLRFGKFAASTGGSVVMTAAGARSKTGAVVLSTIDAGGAASFTVSGAASATYAVTLPSTATLTGPGSPAATMSVGTFTSTPSGTGTLSTGGSQTLTVGGTLTVASAQAVGSYTGTFTVSVEYN